MKRKTGSQTNFKNIIWRRHEHKSHHSPTKALLVSASTNPLSDDNDLQQFLKKQRNAIVPQKTIINFALPYGHIESERANQNKTLDNAIDPLT
ncbi:MAG: hypothetical protein IJT30_11560 [Muribaculaceae bacterium]|nr:hypothetical protein [Muribaculaceae bacterium]